MNKNADNYEFAVCIKSIHQLNYFPTHGTTFTKNG